MATFRPRLSPAGAVSIVLSSLALGLAVILLWRLRSSTFDAPAFFAVGVSLLLILCGVLLLGAGLRLRWLAYYVEDDALRIRWGWTWVVVPLARVERVIRGGQVRGIPRRQLLGWLGYEAGVDHVRDLGRVLFLVRSRFWHDLVFVHTSERTYALSVPHPDRLAAEIEAHMTVAAARRASSPEAVAPEMVLSPVLSFPLPRLVRQRRTGVGEPRERVGLGSDWVALALAAVAALSFLGLAAYVTAGYGGLDALILDRFTTREMAVSRVDASRVFLLPAVAVSLLLLNLGIGFVLHSRERLASYLCFAAATALQIPFWVAAVRVMG